MNQFHTVVLERLTSVKSELETEPYEAGWADEAILFLQLEDVSLSGASVTAEIQISADGINWVNEGTRIGPINEDGASFIRISHFGGWLRARFRVTGTHQPVRLTTQLVLKG